MTWNVYPMTQKWFPEQHPVNYVPNAYATVGALALVHKDMETKCVVRFIASKDADKIAVTVKQDTVVVTLASEAAINTVRAVAEAINAGTHGMIVATFTGNGDSVFKIASETVKFVNGHLGTPCPQRDVCFYDGETYYVCVKENNTRQNTNWRKFTPIAY